MLLKTQHCIKVIVVNEECKLLLDNEEKIDLDLYCVFKCRSIVLKKSKGNM